MEQAKLFKNTISLLINRLVQSITTFLLTVAIARTLGAYALGQYFLAFSYYYTFVSIVSLGLKTLLTRELSRNPQKMPVYLVNGIFLQLLLSIVGYVVMVFLVFILPYSSDTSVVCFIMGLTIIPFALSNITEALFQAEERMDLIAISTVPVYIIRLLVMIWYMNLNHGINYVAGIFVISETLILLIEWILVTRIVKQKGQFKPHLLWQLFKSARTFLAIDAIGIITTGMNVFIISLFTGEFIVGLYGAITQLQQPFTMVVNSLGLAAFPRMTKALDNDHENQRHVTENMIEILMGMALPFIVGIFFLGDSLLKFIYKDPSFSQATLALRVSSLAIILYPFIRIFVYLLLANGLEKFNLIETSITSVTKALSGVLLISKYQLMGAASTELVTAISACGVLTYAVYNRLFSLHLWRIMRRPLLISIGMAGVFFILQEINLSLILTLIISILLYILFIMFFTIHSLGGVTATWEKFCNRS